jgi:hypothetical protein
MDEYPLAAAEATKTAGIAMDQRKPFNAIRP